MRLVHGSIGGTRRKQQGPAMSVRGWPPLRSSARPLTLGARSNVQAPTPCTRPCAQGPLLQSVACPPPLRDSTRARQCVCAQQTSTYKSPTARCGPCRCQCSVSSKRISAAQVRSACASCMHARTDAHAAACKSKAATQAGHIHTHSAKEPGSCSAQCAHHHQDVHASAAIGRRTRALASAAQVLLRVHGAPPVCRRNPLQLACVHR